MFAKQDKTYVASSPFISHIKRRKKIEELKSEISRLHCCLQQLKEELSEARMNKEETVGSSLFEIKFSLSGKWR